jgi:hypothetical protein
VLSCRKLHSNGRGQIEAAEANIQRRYNGCTMKVIRDAERASEPGRPDWFTGTVWLDEIAVGTPPSHLRVDAVTFEPGARTARHAQGRPKPVPNSQ